MINTIKTISPGEDVISCIKNHKEEYLETLLGRPVGLVTKRALKKQLQEQILSEAINVT